MAGKPVTEEELEVIKDTSLTHSQVSEKIGRRTSTIHYIRKTLGINDKCSGHRKTWTEKDLAVVMNDELTTKQKAKKLNMPEHSVRDMKYRIKAGKKKYDV